MACVRRMSASTFTQIERVKSSNALKRKRNSGGFQIKNGYASFYLMSCFMFMN